MFCSNCGNKLEGNAKFCSNCGNKIEKNSNSDNDEGDKYTPTTRGKRFLNFLLDYIFIYFIGLFLVVQSEYFYEMNGYAFNFITMTPFYLITESALGKSPAKFITKTKVINENGEKPGFGKILGRTLVRLVPFEPLSFLTSDRPRGWHDSWSSTIVIDEE